MNYKIIFVFFSTLFIQNCNLIQQKGAQQGCPAAVSNSQCTADSGGCYTPQCKGNLWASTQCSTVAPPLNCWCVDPDTGTRIPNTLGLPMGPDYTLNCNARVIYNQTSNGVTVVSYTDANQITYHGCQALEVMYCPNGSGSSLCPQCNTTDSTLWRSAQCSLNSPYNCFCANIQTGAELTQYMDPNLLPNCNSATVQALPPIK